MAGVQANERPGVVIPRRGFLAAAAIGGSLVASGGRRAIGAPAAITLDVVRQFGAVGDGKADDTAAFKTMHEAARNAQAANPDVQITMLLARGRTFRYTWNRWTWGLRHVTVVADGAAVQNASRSAWDIDKTPINTNRGYYHYYGYYSAPADATTAQLGQYINSVSRNARSVVLKNAGAASGFKPGGQVMIYSYSQQQYGQPPNPRHFDLAKITSVAGGVISIDTPLRFDHKDNYPYLPKYIHCPGRARILLIDRPDVPLGISHKFQGLKTLVSPYTRGAAGSWDQIVQSWMQVTGVLSTELVDCDLRGLAVGEGRLCLARNCKIEYAEPDKCIEEVRFEGCEINAMTSCAGVRQANFTDTRFDYMAICLANRSRFTRCHFHGPKDAADGYGGLNLNGQQPIIESTVTDCHFYGRNSRYNFAVMDIQPFPRVKIGTDVTLLAGPVIRATASTKYGSPYQKLVDGLRVGSIIAIDSVKGAFARVTDIWGDGTYAYFRLDPSVALKGGMVLRLCLLEKLNVTGAVLHSVPKLEIDALSMTWNGAVVNTPPAPLAFAV